VWKLLVSLTGEVHARVHAITAILMGGVRRPNLGALIGASADGIVDAGRGVYDAPGNTMSDARPLRQLPTPIVTFEGCGLVCWALR
jgi:hypothetical protein